MTWLRLADYNIESASAGLLEDDIVRRDATKSAAESAEADKPATELGFAPTYYFAGPFRAPLPGPIIHVHAATKTVTSISQATPGKNVVETAFRHPVRDCY